MTPSRSIEERLGAGEVLLMDGGTGEELRERGADVHGGHGFEGADHEQVMRQMEESAGAYLRETDPVEMRRVHDDFLRRLGPWTAPVNIEAPELVRAVHTDFLRAGADIIISNNFSTSRSKLARLGLADEWERYARAAADLAVEARDAVNPEAYVAGGIAPPVDGDLRSEFTDQARLLAEAGVDVVLAEFVGSIDEAVVAVQACATAGLPVLLGVRHVSDQGTMQYLETFEDLARALDGAPVAAILTMCSMPRHISVALPKLRDAFDGPIGAYSHNPPGESDRAEEIQSFTEYGADWISMGAQIVGGCCRVGPKHIAALAPVVKSRAPASG